MRGIPGMQVFCPADEQDMLIMLPKIWASPYPSYIRAITRKPTYNHTPDFEIGKAEIISKGEDITLLTYGFMFEQALIAKYLLEKEGKSVGLINLRSLKPVDEKAILDAAKSSKLLVTIEDHFLTGGLYSIIAEIFLTNRITADVLPLALEERWFRPALLADVLEYEQFTGSHIARRILEKVNAGGAYNIAATKVENAEFAE
jgi:transketolase